MTMPKNPCGPEKAADKPPKSPEKPVKLSRDEKLAAALRANLKRRKQASRKEKDKG